MRECASLATTFSPALQSAEATQQSSKGGVGEILGRAAELFLYFVRLPFSSILSPFTIKRRPAVKCCNPDAVTMLLSVPPPEALLIFQWEAKS